MYEVLIAMATKPSLHDMAKLITTRGYAVLKSSLTSQETQHLRTELTVSPKVNERYAKGVQNFTLYLESSSRFYVPRQWGLKHLGEPEDNIVSEGTDLPPVIEFIGTPYDYQQEIVDTFIEEGACGLICVPCGRGKTFMALCAAVQIGKRFLIVVDKEFLMNQWKGEIERYIKGARVGILQGPKCEIDPTKYDITICMLQTVCQRDYPAGYFDGYGFTIFDECHHLGAQHFSRVMTKIQTQWALGLSATPHRDDGLNKVFEYFLGPPVYQETTREPDATVQVEAVWYRDSDPTYAEEPVDWKGEIVTARLLTQVVNCKKRTESIIHRLKDLALDKRRKILVLSERRAHLEALHDAPTLATFTRGYYVGGMKQEQLDKNAETCQILFATYAMASEAMNIKALNAMIMASPRKKVEQSTGRILRIRPEHREVDPIIIDVIDQHKTYESRWYQRLKYYRKCNYTIKHVNKPKTTMEDQAKAEATMAQECVIKINA